MACVSTDYRFAVSENINADTTNNSRKMSDFAWALSGLGALISQADITLSQSTDKKAFKIIGFHDVMISFWAERDQRNCLTIKSPLAFFVNLFKKKKYKVRKNHVKEIRHCGVHPKVPTDLSVSVMDMRMSSPCPISPALSTLTLTPGRMRDIDQDMEALRLSRQDNPFLQVLASRESLVESTFESVSDDTNLMSQEFPNEAEVDPLSLPEIHEHMIRSPPPTTWPKSPNFKIFRFPILDSQECLQATHNQYENVKKPSGSIRNEEEATAKSHKSWEVIDGHGMNYSTINSANSLQGTPDALQQRSNGECRESVSNLFGGFSPTPMRSPPENRHLQRSQEDNVEESLERKFEDEALPTIPLLSKSSLDQCISSVRQ